MSPVKRAGLGALTGGASEAFNLIKPKTPDYNAPSGQDPSVQRAMAEEAKRRRASKGYQSTILTSMARSEAGMKQTLGE